MISRFFIDRPVFAVVLSVVIVLAGAVAVFTLPVAQYPEVTPPTVQVTAFYPGANALTVRNTVAAPIEEQVSGVENMLYMSSQCTNDGAYNLTVTFRLGMDTDMAQVLVQNRVSLALPVIPLLVQNEGISVKKMSPNTLMIVNLLSPDDRYDSTFLSNYATIYIKDELGRLPGVAGITYLGQRDYSLRAWLDPAKLAALNLSATDVVTAISQQNLQVAAGQIGQQPVPRGQQFQLTINTLGRLVEPEQFGDIILKAGGQMKPGMDSAAGGSSQGQGGQTSCNLSGRPDRRGRVKHPGRPLAPGHRYCPAARRGPSRTGLTAVRSVLYLGRSPFRGGLHLPIAWIQCARNRRRRLQKDEGAQGPLPGWARLQDRLRHDALYPRVGQRGLQYPARRGDLSRHRRPGVLARLEGHDPADDRCAGLPDRHVRGDGGDGLQPEQPDPLRAGTRHWHRGRRRHRRAGKHRTLDRDRAGLADRHDPGDGGNHRPNPGYYPRAQLGVHTLLFPPRDNGPVFRQFAVTIAVSTIISAINALTMTPSRAVMIFKTEEGSHGHQLKREALPWWIFGIIGGMITIWLARDVYAGQYGLPPAPDPAEDTEVSFWMSSTITAAYFAPGMVIGGTLWPHFHPADQRGLGLAFPRLQSPV